MQRTWLTKAVKDWGLALALALGVVLAWNFLQPRPLSSGEAPTFSLPAVSGEELALADASGQVVVLNFWATWCGPCRAEIPELAAFHEAHPDVPVWGITQEAMGQSRLRAQAKRLGINYPVLQDRGGEVFQAYGVRGIPVTVVVSPAGEIVWSRTGRVGERELTRVVRQAHRAS